MDFTADVTAQMKAFGITLTEEQAVAFTTYYERLVETNQYMNLTAITEPHEVAVKHMVDSLSCYDKVVFVPERLNVLAEWALPYVRKGGYLIALKGAAYEEEIKEAERALSVLGGTVAEVRPVTLPTLADKRAVIYIKKTGMTPKKYPRKPKEIKERHLR